MVIFDFYLNDDVTDDTNSKGSGLTYSLIAGEEEALVFFKTTPQVLPISVPNTTAERINFPKCKINSATNGFNISAWQLRNGTSKNVSRTLTADDSLTRGNANVRLIGGSGMASPSNSSADNSSAALEEKTLLNKLAQGDRQAFWQLWELYRDYLDHRCRVWMGENYFDAKDVMSQAALKAWEKLPNYAQNITNLKGWLNRLVHNLCIDIHRQRARRAVGVENIDDIPFDHQEIESCSSHHPESALLKQELKIYLRHYIASLPSRLREPLILRYYQEMSYADIAQQLLISQDNVAKCLQQAKQILKQQLCKYSSGLNTIANHEAQTSIGRNSDRRFEQALCQQLEQQDFQLPTVRSSTVVEIDYRITSSCLETLPLWCNFHPAQDWI